MNEPRIRQVLNCETQEITYEEITGVELINLEFLSRQTDKIALKMSKRDEAKQTIIDLATKSSVGPFRTLAQAVCDYLGIEPESVHEES